LNDIPYNFPFFYQRYKPHHVRPETLPDPSQQGKQLAEPGLRNMAVGLYETPMKHQGRKTAQQRHTSGYFKALHIEEQLTAEAYRRFDGRFIDFKCDHDPELLETMKEVAQWYRGDDCEQRKAFLAVYQPRPKGGKKTGQLHEDGVTSLLVDMLDAVGRDFLERWKRRKSSSDEDDSGPAATPEPTPKPFGTAGTVPVRGSETVPRDRIDKRRIYKPDFLSFIKPIATADPQPVQRGTKRKGKKTEV
jgi:hypothetical protein